MELCGRVVMVRWRFLVTNGEEDSSGVGFISVLLRHINSVFISEKPGFLHSSSFPLNHQCKEKASNVFLDKNLKISHFCFCFTSPRTFVIILVFSVYKEASYNTTYGHFNCEFKVIQRCIN